MGTVRPEKGNIAIGGFVKIHLKAKEPSLLKRKEHQRRMVFRQDAARSGPGQGGQGRRRISSEGRATAGAAPDRADSAHWIKQRQKFWANHRVEPRRAAAAMAKPAQGCGCGCAQQLWGLFYQPWPRGEGGRGVKLPPERPGIEPALPAFRKLLRKRPWQAPAKRIMPAPDNRKRGVFGQGAGDTGPRRMRNPFRGQRRSKRERRTRGQRSLSCQFGLLQRCPVKDFSRKIKLQSKCLHRAERNIGNHEIGSTGQRAGINEGGEVDRCPGPACL